MESHDSDESIECEEDVETQTLVMRRSRHTRKQPNMYSPLNFHSNFALSATVEEDPRTVKEAIDSMEGELWKKAMEEEIKSLRKNDTWDLVGYHDARKTIDSKWVFKRKTNATGRVKKYKD